MHEADQHEHLRLSRADYGRVRLWLPAKTNFKNLLVGLAKKSPNGKYVLLIDEYDAPIAGLLDTEEGRSELVAVRKTPPPARSAR